MARPKGEDRGLFERPKDSGVWWIQWSDQYSKVHREKIGSKATARRVYQKRKTDVVEGRKLPDLKRKELTLAQLVDRYKEETAAKKSGAWDARIAAHWIERLGEWQIEAIQPGDIEKVKSAWLKECQPGTVNRRLAYLKTLYGKAVRDEITDRNPLAAKRVKMLRENPAERPILLPESEEALFGAFGRQDVLAILLSLHTGMRISEVMEAARTDANVKRKTLAVEDAKGGGRQQIFLSPIALAVVRELLEATKGSKWLFPAPTGDGHLSQSVLSHRFSRIAERLGLVDLTFHCLRHTYISRLVMVGTPIVTVQRLARHKSIQMTLRYAHLAPDHTWGALDTLVAAYPVPSGVLSH